MSEFYADEIVNVRIDGVRYHLFDESTGEHEIQTATGARYQLPPTAAIEWVMPKEWPPRLGDIWGGRNGAEWFAQRLDADGDIKLTSTEDGTPEDAERVWIEYGPLTPLRRRGWGPERLSADKPAPEVDERRAAAVAGLRAFADLVQAYTDVPVPYAIDGQVGFGGPDGLAEALRLAETLGVDLAPLRDTGLPEQRWSRTAKVRFGGDVTLTLYVYGLDAPEPVEAAPDGGSEATS